MTAKLRTEKPVGKLHSVPVAKPRAVPAEPRIETPASPPDETLLAQWADKPTDRLTFCFWLTCFAFLSFLVLAEGVLALFR